MACDEYKDLMMGYLDNELTHEQRTQFEEHIAAHPECAAEFEEFKKLQQITDSLSLAEPEDKIWDQYWSSTYNRIERGLGWIVFSAAAILLFIFGGFKLIEEIVTDPTIDIILKGGLLLLIVGLAILFMSILRERLFIQKKDRYKDVRR
jgi:hypothetical protein